VGVSPKKKTSEMRVLIIGGSGHVGRLIVPKLARAPFNHTITVFDRAEPAYEGVRFVRGDLLAPGELAQAFTTEGDDFEAVIYLAMPSNHLGESERVAASFAVNAGGVWTACADAERAGVRRFVYASSLSVYDDPLTRTFPSEDVPADADALYGLTKRFGEEVVARFARRGAFDASFALRLCFPVETAEDVVRCVADGRDCALNGDETARAFHQALIAAPPPAAPHGFAPVFVVGAHASARVNLGRARDWLGWKPDAPPPVSA